MSDHAAIQAQLVDVRNVGQHKSIKLTLHVPAERAALVMRAFGWPTMADPVPVALARLNPENVKEVMPNTIGAERADARHDKTSPASEAIPARARKPVDPEKRLAQRAGIISSDVRFHRYLLERHDVLFPRPSNHTDNTEVAAEFIRNFCQVASRADLRYGEESGTRFDLLESSYVAWRDVPELADAQNN